MSMMGSGPPGQGTAGATDVVSALKGITQQLTALVKAFQSRNTFGSFTLAASASTVVAQPAAQANSSISWTPTNAAAGTLEGSAKKLYLSSISPGVSFTVATASAAAAAGTEAFSYRIETPS
jgi:hypothetical protein